MADPIVVKVSALTEHTALVPGDLFIVVAVNESNVQDKTKKLPAANVKLFNANQITDGIVTQSKIVDAAISTAKIADNAVTNTKIVDSAVSTAKIADNAITTAKITDASVTRSKLAIMDHPIAVPLTGMDEAVLTTSKAYVPIPAAYNGYTLVSVMLTIDTKSAFPTVVNIKNDGGSLGNVTLNANAANSNTVTLNHALVTNEHLIFTVTSTGTDGKGLFIVLNITG